MLLRKFSWLYRCANWRCRDFFAAENIKDIKSFRAKKIGFNISGNYSGRSRMRVNVARVPLGLYQIWKTKTKINPFSSEEVHRPVVYFHLFSMMISAGWGLFPVYRLVLDAKPDRVMLWLAENSRACSRDSQPVTVSMARQSHFASSARGFSCFCFISGHRIFETTPHYFDLSSYLPW